MADAYQLLLEAPREKIEGQIFNIGHENLTIANIAVLVSRVVLDEFPDEGPIDLVQEPSDDPRSYHINSDKIERVLGYRTRRSVADAVRDLCEAFRKGSLQNTMTDDRYYNVRAMKTIGAR